MLLRDTLPFRASPPLFWPSRSGRLAAQTGPGAAAVDPAIAKLLAGIRAADKGQLAVSEEDGRFLRVLVGATNARQVLEIGAASGYSRHLDRHGPAADRRQAR